MITPGELHHIFETYGIWTVAIMVGLESLGIPLPGEAVLIIASVYAATHDGNIALVIAAASLGAIIGDNIGYLIGRKFGYPLLVRFGPYVGITEGRIKLGQYLFQKYGGMIVFIGRFFAILRFLAALLAGINKLPWPRFLLANALGGVLWASAVGMAAYTLGRSIDELHGPAGAIGIALAVATAIAIFIYLKRHEAELQAEAETSLPGPLPGFPPGERSRAD
ncbi:DedA family protein [Hyphomicrobium sp.]|uniref:DedA family protein n=1 Tax=Hyphomicrobium sp. TaxID=82 RepID=UPI002D788125|nr:DedA family protein [Hyphomicrobium sp.]HET6389929.1 DedA family protein [Hyphomicrobium sp.]